VVGLLAVGLTFVFVQAARSIRKEHKAGSVASSGDSKRTPQHSWTGCSTAIDKVAPPTGTWLCGTLPIVG
jgi:hypothetical protein